MWLFYSILNEERVIVKMNVIKKIFFIALMIWLLFYVSSYATTATVNTDAVRLRREATTTSDVITILYNNEEVTLIEEQGQWYKVKYKDYIGFIRTDLLNLPVEQATPEEQPSTPEVETPDVQEYVETNQPKVVNKNTSLRVIPSIAASKTDEITAGTIIKVIQVKNNWTCIEFNGKSAWLPNIFLSNNVEENNTQNNTETVEVIKVMYINVSSANIRTEPTTSSKILTTLVKNNSVEILEDVGEWYKIKLNDSIGYISKPLVSDQMETTTSRSIEEPRQEISIQETVQQPEEVIIKPVYVNVEKANLRSSATTSSNIVGTANRKDKLEVIAEEDQWYKIKFLNENAYIRKDLVVNTIEEVKVPVANTEINNNNTVNVENSSTPTGEAIVEYAKQFLGYRYVYGGAGPTSFDCSGFTQYIYKNFGIYLSHSAVAQANNGTYIEKSNLQLGDLIIFKDWDNISIGHCGIYIGNSQFIHAANSSRGVVTDTFASGYYYERYVSARRLF